MTLYNEKMEQMDIKSGYIVNLLEYETTTKDKKEVEKTLKNYSKLIQNKKDYYIKYTINNNIYNINIVKNVARLKDTEKTARKNLQKEIVKCSDGSIIKLDYNIKYHTLYKIIRDKNNMIIDYKLIKQFDSTHDIPSNYRTDKNNYIIDMDYININEL